MATENMKQSPIAVPRPGDLLIVLDQEGDWFMGWARPSIKNGETLIARKVTFCLPSNCPCKNRRFFHHVWVDGTRPDLHCTVAVVKTKERLDWEQAHPMRAYYQALRTKLLGQELKFAVQPPPYVPSDDEIIAGVVAEARRGL